MRSLRRTLAVRFCITVFFALLLIALWAYLGAQRILRSELDSGLAAASELEADVLAARRATSMLLCRRSIGSLSCGIPTGPSSP
jgi:hypothetical protein